MAIVTSYKDIGKATHVMYSLPMPGAGHGDEEPDIGVALEKKTYKVRGMTPKEVYKHASIMSQVKMPQPPIKKRSAPMPGAVKLDAASLIEEEYSDFNDPTYKEEQNNYQDEQIINLQRSTMYALMVCVEGLDLMDAEILEELKAPAEPKEPLTSLLLRLDQLSEIIMSDFDQSHMMALRKKIHDMSGMGDEQVNFT